MSAPKSAKSWTVQGTKNGFSELKYDANTTVETPGEWDVLVKLQGGSLNYRDLIIPMGKYSFPTAPGVVPGSDGAGTVVSVGKNVKRFKAGDKVLTLFNQKHYGGPLDQVGLESGLGGAVNGTFREYGSFQEDGLVHMPSNLNFKEAATLSCAGLTAWNALFGLTDKRLKQGDYVLTQGTGGVSLFAVQFAKAAGAKVIATTGSDDKAKKLKELGADHIINYKSNPEWGQAAKELTPGKRGVDHVVEVAGPRSMTQSLASIAVGGVITIIGFVGGGPQEKEPGFLNCLVHQCLVRGVLVGDRVMLEEMCRAVEANDSLKPVIDPKVFHLESLKEAYEYQFSQQHVGKVCIDIP